MTNKDVLAHFPSGVSDELAKYVRDTVFLKSRYLFVWRVEKRVQMAYCTHCETEYPLGIGQASFKHNEETQCLNCGSLCVVKSNGRKRTRLVDGAYVVWYDKSLVDSNAVVAREFYVERNYAGDYRQTVTKFSTCAMYLFEPWRGGRQFRPGANGELTEQRSVYSYVLPRIRTWSYWLQAKTEAFCSHESIEQAVSGTVLQYSMWSQYEDQSLDFVTFFDLAARYPCVEYLTKMGLSGLVTAKLTGQPTYGVVNWRGKSVAKVLRMPKSDIRQLTQLKDIEPKSLHSYHFWRKHGWSISPADAHLLRQMTDGYYWSLMETHSAFGSVIEIVKYVLKQMKRPDAPQRYNTATYVLTEWRDYLKTCKDLGIDTQRQHVAFPTNLATVHDKVTRKVLMKRDAAINRIIQARASALEVFAYDDGRFLIRPAKSSLELFDEGKALQHCVGSYAADYANGRLDLYVLRQVADPNTPLCTVEVRKGKIVQARGYKNGEPDETVSKFLNRFARRIAKDTKKRTTKAAQNHALAG